jgi:hypothetical protein
MPEPAAPSKPQSRPRRFWLWAPYVAVAVLAAAGAIGWFGLKIGLERGLDATAQRLTAQGYALSWKSRRVDGFPFRLDLTLEEPRIAEPSGWALAAAQLKGEAFAYDPGHWILAAPSGVILTRPGKGAVAVSGQALRASLGALGTAAPRFAFEGLKLAFKPEPGATAMPIVSADRLEMHLQPGPGDQAALLVRLDGGRAEPSGALGHLAGAKPVALIWDSRLSHLSQIAGVDWPSAVRRWVAAGGQMTVVQAGLTLGGATLASQAGSLTVGEDGRLRGALPLTLRQGEAALDALGAARALDPDAAHTAAAVARARQGADGSAAMALTFQAGVATLGPVNLGPALKLY